MQMVIIIGFVLALTLHQSGQWWSACDSPAATLAAIGGYLLGLAALTSVNAALAARVARAGESRLPAALRVHRRGMLVVNIWLLAGQAGVALVGYGRLLAETDLLRRIPLAGEAAALAPLIVGIYVVWLGDYPFYRAVRRCGTGPEAAARPAWSLGEYFAYNTRHQLLFVAAPVGLILLAVDCLELLARRWLVSPQIDYVMLGGSLAAAAAVFLLAPLLIVRIWKTARLSDGPLRSELEAACARLRLSYRELLVWQSGGVIANAGVMGVLGRVRYILLSDGLLEGADTLDVQAVFAHEAGHVIHHHIFYGGLFAVGSICLVASLVEAAGAAMGWEAWMVEAAALAALAAVWGLGFGWISRRFERQCDVLAAWSCGQRQPGDDGDLITSDGAAIFSRALQCIARLNGLPQAQFNWRHGSIASRVAYVLYLGGTRGTRRPIDRTIARIKLALWLQLAAGLAAAVALEFVVG